MNQNSTSAETLTKQELKAILKDFGTDLRTAAKADLENVLNNLRDEIKTEIRTIRTEIKAEIKTVNIRTDIKREKMELRIDDRAREYNSTILTRFDNWAGELMHAKEDRVLSTNQISELREDVAGHEKRIKKLEKVHN